MGPAGFEVRQAVNGAAAIKDFELWRPQLILMDLRMPVMDGYEATRRVRALPGGKEVKIIAVTASIFGEINRDALAAGADNLMLKPFREAELFEKMGSLLGAEYVYEEEASAGYAGEQTAGTLLPGSVGGLPPELAARLRKAAVAGDFQLLMELADSVEAQNARLAATLRALAEKFDTQRILALLAKN